MTTINEQEQSMDTLQAEIRRLRSENLEQKITIDNLKSKVEWLRDQRKILTKYGKQQ